ncbi:MAG TPA: hypothetical protein VIH57_13615, partial [Bacteroidales bacterium]
MKIIKYILLICTLCGWYFLLATSCKKNDVSGGKGNDTTVSVIKYIDTLSQSVLLKHPGGLCTQSDFERIKEKVGAGAEPWMSGWNKLISNSHAQIT